MQFRFSVLFACLLATTLVCAKNGLTHISYHEDIDCDPPSDLQVIQRGPTSVTLTFVPFSDLTPTRIKIYRTSDDSMLVNTVIPAGMTKAFIENLPLGIPLYATGNSICEGGIDGPPSERIDIISIILDLIVAGFTPGSVEPSCTITSIGNSCNFDSDGTITPFKIATLTEIGYESRQFAVQYVASENKLHTIMGLNGNENQKFKLYCDNGASPCNLTSKIYIKYVNLSGRPITVAVFGLSHSSNTGQLTCLSLYPNSYFERMAPESIERPASPSHERNDLSPTLDISATVSPNPFSDHLEVFQSKKNNATQIQLQLFNLAGQEVLDQQFPAGQDQYTLSTEKLNPGFYLLRIEADGEVQTLKVIKSE